MYKFLESIQLNDGKFKRLLYHQARVNCVFETYFRDKTSINLEEFLSKYQSPTRGVFKCRLIYDYNVQSVEFQQYTMRNIETLQLVETDMESAFYKSENREKLNQAFSQRGNCDDVILVKEGLLTDASYCNIALYNGDKWITPRIPLIYGVNRTELLENKIINEGDIRVDDLKNYSIIRLFNAMIEFGELEIRIENIAL